MRINNPRYSRLPIGATASERLSTVDRPCAVVARTGSPLYRRLATGRNFLLDVEFCDSKLIRMPGGGLDRDLDRVRHELRVSGLKRDGTSHLLSGIHTRGYLPHVKREGASYFVTFRLADSLPRETLLEFERLRDEKLCRISPGDRESKDQANRELRRRIERDLDAGRGACYLRRPEISSIIAKAMLFFHEKRYVIDEWVIMPNHVHLILWPFPNETLSAILRSRKRYTAREANRVLKRTGKAFWQPESYDHWIRNDDEKARIRRYIRNNPVSAGLCRAPEDWQWGSAWNGAVVSESIARGKAD